MQDQPYSNQIICGDAADVLTGFPDASVDLVVTDPPYLVRYRDRSGRRVANDDNKDAVLAVYDELFRVLKPNSYCVTFYGQPALADFVRTWDDAGFRVLGHIVWPKRYVCGFGHVAYRHEEAFVLAKGWPRKPEKPISDVQPWEYTGNRVHPTQKAVSVIEPLVRGFSKPGDLVLDPFTGSGTTCVAAALSGRRYVGIELEPHYCDLAELRLAGVRRKTLAA